MSTINERISLLRKELGLTQEEFGVQIGIKKSAVSKLENGTNNPTDSTCKLMVRTFHVNAVWLETGEGNMFSDELTDEKVDAMFKKADPFVRTWMKTLARLPDNEWEYFKRELAKIEDIRNGRV